jgi:hypothetical protein
MTSQACVAIILVLECSPEKAKKRKGKQYLMKEWFKKRVTFSNQNLLQELLVSSQVDYNNFMRMEHMVTPLIQKETTVMREAISTTEKLSTTLRFLCCH